jgi:hypothetical protein
MEQVHAIVDGSSSFEQALRRLAAAAESAGSSANVPAIPAADLVVSSLVLSELHRYPLSYADRLLRDKFRLRLADWSGREQLRARLQRLAVEDHSRLLAALLRPGGAIYYADTIARGPLHERIGIEARRRVLIAIFPELSRLDLFGQTSSDESLRQSFLTGFKNIRPRWGDDTGPAPEDLLRNLVEQKPLSAADRGAVSELIVNLSCRGRFPIEREIKAFELLLEACSDTPGAFEPLIPVEDLPAQWRAHGLRPQGESANWWWLEYPCSIAYSSGAFQVRSWILRQAE